MESPLENMQFDTRPTSCTPSLREEPLFLQNIKQPVVETFQMVRTILPNLLQFV